MSLSQLGLEWTCVGILRSKLGFILGCLLNYNFSYDYKYDIIVFDWPIDVLMWIGW